MNSWSIRYMAAATLMLGAGALAACATDVETEGTDTSTNPGQGTTSEPEGTTTTGGGDECGPSSIDMDDPCEVCIGTKCTAEAMACCEAPGCLDVVYCAAAAGCNGVECYAPDKCQAEIDAAGLETAMNEAQTLGDCAIAACPDECEHMVPPQG